MNYNQEALEQWALAAKQKDEDSLALAKYASLDIRLYYSAYIFYIWFEVVGSDICGRTMSALKP